MRIIYTLCEPGSDRPRYVGMTSKTLKLRMQGHMCQCRYKNGLTPVTRWINGLREQGKRPVARQLEVVETTGRRHIYREAELIREFASRYPGLLNVRHDPY